MKDTEELVIQLISRRKGVGLKKYGVSVADNPLDEDAWIQHALEECVDMAIYLMRLKQERAKRLDDGK